MGRGFPVGIGAAALLAAMAATPVAAAPADNARAVQNLMSRRAIYQMRGDSGAVTKLFASKQPDVSVMVMGRTIKGYDNIQKMFSAGPPPEISVFTEHSLLTPIIEIAADGKTAKGFWQSFGPLAIAGRGAPVGRLSWENYGVDFIKEDGVWKIWHIAVFNDFSIGMGQTLADKLNPAAAPPAGGPGGPPGGPGNEPSRPNPYPEWSPGRMPSAYPLPVPYRTFSETFSYGDLPAN